MREQFGDEEETQGVSTSMRKAAICIKKEDYFSVILLNYQKMILFHIFYCCLPERKKGAGGTFLAQDCKMREHFGDEEEMQGVSTFMRKAAIRMKKEDYFSVILLNYQKLILFHILDSCLSRCKSCNRNTER